jgi:RNA polymerase sigma-70 factor (ECF subfamily)
MAKTRDATAAADSLDADAALMRSVGAGDAAACRLLVERHLRRIVTFAYRMLGDVGEAEDVAQETFLRLWVHARRWRPEARLGTWLHRVAHNLCIDRLRARREWPSDRLPDRADPSDGAVAARQRSQVAEALEAAIAALPERQRTAIMLVYYDEIRNVEAAEIMGVSVEALESLLARARRSLRRRLQDRRTDLMGEG